MTEETLLKLVEALEREPENGNLRRFLAEACLRRGMPGLARDVVLEAPVPPATEDEVVFAARLVGGSDPAVALGWLEEFLEMDPVSARAHLMKAELHRAQGQEREEAAHRAEAESLDPAARQPARFLQLEPAVLAGFDVPEAVTLPPLPGQTAVMVAAVPSGKVDEADETGERVLGVRLAMAESGLLHPEVRTPRTGSAKITAVTVAILVHLVVVGLFGLVVMSLPQATPPQIYASISSVDLEENLHRSEIQKPTVQKRTPAAQQTQVMTSALFSDVALPTVEANQESLMAGMSGEVGMDFGMSFDMSGGGSSAMANIPPSMAGRCSMGQRMQRLKESGATTACEAAVRKALRFLTSTQNEDGSFGDQEPAALTGLVLLALLGHCETPDSVEYGSSVVEAALYLMERARRGDGGLIRSPGGQSEYSGGRPVEYEHAIATYALCELYTMTKASGAAARIPRLESVTKAAVEAIIDAQARNGGWGYGYQEGHIDTSVSGWNFQALKAATYTGERYPGLEDALDRAIGYFREAQNPDGGFAYQVGGETKTTLGGVGAMAYEMWAMSESPESEKALDWLETHKIGKGEPQAYDWYYNMQAFFLKGGERWTRWNGYAMQRVLDAQREDGSFQINAGHGPQKPLAGTIYTTALCTLMLEVYYRYLPTTQKNLGTGG